MAGLTMNGTTNGSHFQEDHAPSHGMSILSLSSQAVHADDYLNINQDVAPALHVSTTFRYSKDPDKLAPSHQLDPDIPFDGHIYSRATAPNTTRLEAILSTLLKGPTLTYASGLSAFHAALVLLHPKRISIGDGYHGIHGVIGIHQKLTGLMKLSLDCAPDDLHPGDIVHVETPLNPNGTASNLAHFAAKAHSRGAFLTVDATFAPPPLQDPFLWGADLILHSGTKYIGGHSDMLCGILAVNPTRQDWFKTLTAERLYLGNVMGSMEAWLGIRSVRTLEVRVERQAHNAEKLVAWLHGVLHANDRDDKDDEDSKVVRAVLADVQHASLQTADIDGGNGWLAKQMPNGYGAVFAIWMQTEALARRFPSKLALFHHATSLGGVESLIEWRTMSDPTVDGRLLRVSTGVEGWEDLKGDMMQGFKGLAEELGNGLTLRLSEVSGK